MRDSLRLRTVWIMCKKSWEIIVLTNIIAIIALSMPICAKCDAVRQQTTRVTAEYIQKGVYQKQLINQTSIIVSYNDDIEKETIINDIADTQEKKKTNNQGTVFTLRTSLTTKDYKTEQKNYPEIKAFDSLYDYVTVLDIQMAKILAYDKSNKNIIKTQPVTELKKKTKIRFSVNSFDKTKKIAYKCFMLRIHRDKVESIPVKYNEKTGEFEFNSNKFSDYILYFSLKDRNGGQKPDPITPTATPTITPTTTPTIAPTILPTQSPTASPTKNPTIAPTFTPTITPVPIPTQNITPTPIPTKANNTEKKHHSQDGQNSDVNNNSQNSNIKPAGMIDSNTSALATIDPLYLSLLVMPSIPVGDTEIYNAQDKINENDQNTDSKDNPSDILEEPHKSQESSIEDPANTVAINLDNMQRFENQDDIPIIELSNKTLAAHNQMPFQKSEKEIEDIASKKSQVTPTAPIVAIPICILIAILLIVYAYKKQKVRKKS